MKRIILCEMCKANLKTDIVDSEVKPHHSFTHIIKEHNSKNTVLLKTKYIFLNKFYEKLVINILKVYKIKFLIQGYLDIFVYL